MGCILKCEILISLGVITDRGKHLVTSLFSWFLFLVVVVTYRCGLQADWWFLF